MGRIRFLTAGESHGQALTGIIDGVPAGMEISSDDFAADMKRRRAGIGRSGRMKLEGDKIEILAGVSDGKTTGAPIAVQIKNQIGENWIEKPREHVHVPRPGHADFAGARKFDLENIRDVIERASARETAVRVALGVIAKKFLSLFDIQIISRPLQIAGIAFEYENLNPTSISLQDGGLEKMFDETQAKYAERESELLAFRKKLENDGDSAGGVFQIIAHQLPIGLGSYSQADNRLDSKLAFAVISIPSVKSCSFGTPLKPELHTGLKYHDEFDISGSELIRKTNNAGGIEGGISNGEPIVIQALVKPIPTTGKHLQSIDLKTGMISESGYENADLWIVEAAGVVGEAVTALVLLDAFLEKFGGDSVSEINESMKN